MINVNYSGESEEGNYSLRSDPPLLYELEEDNDSQQRNQQVFDSPKQENGPTTKTENVAAAARMGSGQQYQTQQLSAKKQNRDSNASLDYNTGGLKSQKTHGVAKDVKSEQSSKLVLSQNVNKDSELVSESRNSAVFKGDEQEIDKKVSDILKGNFAPIEIPLLDIPGIRPLVYDDPDDLLAQIGEKDEFYLDEEEEEFLMFTAEVFDRQVRRQDGPHQTLRWRKKVRLNKRDPTATLPDRLIIDEETLPSGQETDPAAENETLQTATEKNAIAHAFSEGSDSYYDEEEEPPVDDTVASQEEGGVKPEKSDSYYDEEEEPPVDDTVASQEEGGVQPETTIAAVVSNVAPALVEDEDDEALQEQVANDYVSKVLSMVQEAAKSEQLLSMVQEAVKSDEPQTPADVIDEKIELPTITKACFELTNEPEFSKEGLSSRVVQLDSGRWAVHESLEQIFVKEFESVWINDQQQFDALNDKKQKKSKSPKQKSTEEKAEVEVEDELVDEVVRESQGSVIDEAISEDGVQQQESMEMLEDEIIQDENGDDGDKDVSIEMEEEEIMPMDTQSLEEIVPDDKGGKQSQESLAYDNDDDQFEQSSTRKVESKLTLQDSVVIESTKKVENRNSSQEDLAYVTDENDDEGVKRGDDEEGDQSGAASHQTSYNPGAEEAGDKSGHKTTPKVTLAKSKTRKMSLKKKSAATKVISNQKELEFALLRAQQEKQNNVSSKAYVRRQPPPKLIQKPTSHSVMAKSIERDSVMTLKPKNPPVPRFKHPTASQSSLDSSLIEKPVKKPRVPVVPDELRASAKSPTPAEILRQSIERSSIASKKPRVPKVTELMPNAIIIKPSESQKSIGSSTHSPSKVSHHSPPKKFPSRHQIFQTPSMSNIPKFPPTDVNTVKSFRSKSKEKGSTSPSLEHRMSKKMFKIVNPAGRRVANFKKKKQPKHYNKAVSREILLHEESPEQTEELYGNVRLIKVRKEDAMRQLRNKRSEYSIQVGSYATLPANNTSQSPQSSSNPQTSRIPLKTLPSGSSQPYEQQLVSQLIDAYRKERHRPKLVDLHPTQGEKDRRTTHMPKISSVDDGDIERQPFDYDAYSNNQNVGTRMRSEIPFGVSVKSGKDNLDDSSALNSFYAETQQSRAQSNMPSSKINHPNLNLNQPNTLPKGLKIYSPFSPTTQTRLVALKNKARNFGEESSNKRDSRHQLKKLNSNMSGGVQDPSFDLMTSLQEAGMNIDHQESRHTFHAGENSQAASFADLLKVNPSWVALGKRKSTFDFENLGKKSIYEILKQNSKAFLKKEKQHIDGFKHAQKVQKKNLDMINANSATSLAPIATNGGNQSQRNMTLQKSNSPRSQLQDKIRRQKKYSTQEKTLDVSGGGNKPHHATNTNFFNTYAVMEEYGNQSSSRKQVSQGGGVFVPKLAATNQTDFKILSRQMKSQYKNNDQHSTGYPPVSGVVSGAHSNITGGKDNYSYSGMMPELMTGRNRGPDDTMAKLASSNHSNFFPSFDSRGNIGVVEDADEFNPKKKGSNLHTMDQEGGGENLFQKGLPQLNHPNSRSGSKQKLKSACN